MEKDVKQKKARYGLLLIILGVLITAAGVLSFLLVPDGFDYVVPAPEISGETPVEETLDKLKNTMEAPWAASLRQQRVPVSSASGGRQNASATVYAVSEGFFDIFHETLAEGQLLNRVDLESETIRALVNSKGAQTLFAGGSALGKNISAEGQTLEIVGILDGGFIPGETDEVLLYIPITAANKGTFHFQTLEIKTCLDEMASMIEEQRETIEALENRVAELEKDR